jgi:sigma-B regulation protein RsbU (phosphoserine phosphatase)
MSTKKHTTIESVDPSEQIDLRIEETTGISAEAAALESSDSNGALVHDQISSMGMRLGLMETLLTELHKNQEFSEFVHEILLALMKAVPSEAGSILEADHKQKHFFFRAAAGVTADDLKRQTVAFGKGIVGYVAESHNVMEIAASDKNIVHFKELEQRIGFTSRNLIAAPIIIRGKVFGVIELLNRVGESRYLPSDVDFLDYISKQISKALEIRLVLNWIAQQRVRKSQGEAA